MTKLLKILCALAILLSVGSSCKRFVFGEIVVDEENNPLVQKKVPRTGADLFEAPVVNADLPNPDPQGAFANWATCLVMFKEGHPHGGGKLHGNFVYAKAPWRQEQFAIIHNTASGIEVEIDRSSVVTYLETKAGKKGPDHFRIIGGNSKLWGLCFYFYDKQGKLLNEEILKHSDQYQIFFSISDLDDKGQPYDVMDVRYTGSDQDPIPSKYFAERKSFEQRRLATPKLLTYTYRDTWLHDDMADGVRELFNLRLLPPFTRKTYTKAYAEDQDYVGLKGHIRFDYDEPIDWQSDWPILRTDGRYYDRGTNLLPHFYLAVRVLKCAPGKKAILPKAEPRGENKFVCAPYYAPNEASAWQELIRINLPIRVFTSTFDSDPTDDDPNEPYFVNLGREIGLSPREAYDAVNNIIIHGDDGSGGSGYGSWFL
ncbi:MAG: hypothetical protein Q4A64_08290 [Porphyromonadaceae bacterium]|nr:hypothetical protein [Porphyromonadaceae bacterium]